MIAGRAQPAIIILFGIDIAAVSKKRRLLQRLAECHIGADALARALLIIQSDDIFDGAIEQRLGIAPVDEIDHLRLSDGRLAEDCYALGRLEGKHHRDVEGGRVDNLSLAKFFLIEFNF